MGRQLDAAPSSLDQPLMLAIGFLRSKRSGQRQMGPVCCAFKVLCKILVNDKYLDEDAFINHEEVSPPAKVPRSPFMRLDVDIARCLARLLNQLLR